MNSTTYINLPLSFNYLVELAKALPKKEKLMLLEALQHNEPSGIPEWQKQEIRKRVKKYEENSSLLIGEMEALKIINEF